MTGAAGATARPRRRLRVDPWSAAALAVAALVVLPIAAVVWLAATPEENVWPHLLATVLPRYARSTLLLMLGVGALAAAVGTGAAWLVTMYRFPGARALEWLLLLPLAVPGYLGAYALVDFLEYSGPVQTGLRWAMGWRSARDYAFPEIRSLPSAVVVLAASLYPYVYLLARAAFREQSGAAYEVARALGSGPLARFWRVGLPLARPAIAAGTAVVMMETVNDFGTVDFFAVQTLTTGIFSIWLETGNAGGAAQIACVMLGLILALVLAERLGRGRLRFHRMARAARPVEPVPLRGWRGCLAASACALPFGVGFALPVAVLARHAADRAESWADPALLAAFGNTLLVGGAAAVVTVAAALVLVYAVRLSGRRLPRLLLPATMIGYAAPGAVLAVGILIPLGAADNALADFVAAATGYDPGLLLTGTAAALVYAYAVRFFALAQGASDAAMGRVGPNLPLAARTLGRTAGGTLRAVYVPLIRGSVGSALLLVFVDCVKELPATLLLRPFNYDTLATRTHEQASLERIADAAPPGLLIVGVGLLAVLVLAQANLRARPRGG